MRYALSTILTLLTLSLFSQDQFRMVGNGTWSTINDSTYQATLTLSPDLTGGGYLGIDVTTDFRVFTGTEQVYQVTNVSGAFFDQVTLRIEEYDGRGGSPSGQVFIYDPEGRWTIPNIPFASFGSTAQIQAAVDSYNSRVYTRVFANRDTAENLVTEIVDPDNIWDVTGGLKLSTATNPYGGSDEIGAVIDSLANNFSDSGGSNFLGSFKESTIDITVSIDSIEKYERYTLVSKSDTVGKNLRVLLPYPSINTKGKSFEIIDSSGYKATTYIQPSYSQTPNLYVNGRLSTRYNLSQGEKVIITQTDGAWYINNAETPVKSVASLLDTTLRFSRGDVIELAGSRLKYKVVTKPTVPVDNFLVYEVNEKSVGNANLLYRSGAIVDADPNDWVINGSGNVDNYSVEAPDGSMTGMRITRVHTNNNPSFYQEIEGDFDIGDTLTISMWAKKPANSRWDFQVDIIPGTSVIKTLMDSTQITSEWKKFSAQYILNEVPGTNPTVRFLPRSSASISIGHYIDVWGIQVERGSVASDYKETGEETIYGTGKLYAQIENLNDDGILEFSNGVFDVDEYLMPNLNYRQKVQYALNYCDEYEVCSEIVHSENFTIDSTLYIPQGDITFTGHPKQTIYLDLNDSTQNAIELLDGNNPKPVVLRHLRFDALSEGRAIISLRYNRRGVFEDIFMHGGEDRLYTYGLIGELDTVSPVALYNDISRMSVAGFKYGFYFTQGNRWRIDNITTSNVEYGVYSTAGGLKISAGSFDGTDRSAVYYDGGGDLVMMGVYSEALNRVDTNSASYNIVAARKFTALDVYHNTGNGMKSRAVFKLNDVKNVSIRNLYTATVFPLWLTDSVGFWEIEYVTQANDNNSDIFYRTDLIPESTLERGKINGQRARNIVNLQNKQWIRHSHLDSSRISNPVISDTLFLHNTKIKGKTQNLVYPSEQIGVGVFTNFSVYANQDVSPVQDSTAEIIVADTTFGGDSFWYTISGDLKANTQYVLSFWGKSNDPNSRCYIGTNQVGYKRSPDIKSTYYRRYLVQFTTDEAISGLGLRVGTMALGDTLTIWGMQVNEGLYPLEYIQTVSSVVDDEIPRLSIQDTLHLKDGVTRIDSLHLQKVLDSDGDLPTDGQFLRGQPNGSADWTSTVTASDISSSGDSSTVQLEIIGLDTRVTTLSSQIDSLKWHHYTPSDGDTIFLSEYLTKIFLGSGFTVYIDESNLTDDALLSVVQASGIGTIRKADGVSNRFYELGTDRSYSRTVGTGSVKQLYYRQSVNHWYTDNYYQADVPIEDVTTTTDTIAVYRGMEIAMDGTSGSYTVQLDLTELNEGEAFNIKVSDVGASTITVDALNETNVIQYEADVLANTHDFTGSYFYVHCSWRGGILYITR